MPPLDHNVLDRPSLSRRSSRPSNLRIQQSLSNWKPDIVVDQMIVHRRIVSPQGLARPGYDTDKQSGLVLTAEEIKDIVSSTGLWLVVRENVGGVGKVSRKGDGWRIRA